LLLAGCSRSADPLDWKIEAGDPTEMQAWLGKHLPAMPAAVSRELNVCINNISLKLPPARTGAPAEKVNRLCQRLDGKTVREVLIEGNELSYQMLLARTKTLSDDILRLTNVTERLTDAQEEQLAEIRVSLGQTKTQLDRAEKRVAELRAGGSK
jgi:hypothetical protein